MPINAKTGKWDPQTDGLTNQQKKRVVELRAHDEKVFELEKSKKMVIAKNEIENQEK